MLISIPFKTTITKHSEHLNFLDKTSFKFKFLIPLCAINKSVASHQLVD